MLVEAFKEYAIISSPAELKLSLWNSGSPRIVLHILTIRFICSHVCIHKQIDLYLV